MRWLFSLLICMGGAAHAAPLQYYEALEPHMGSLTHIEIYAPSVATARRAFSAAFARITELDNTLSDYKPESELSRLSTSAIGKPVRVSDDLFTVLAASQKLAAETGGAFDITLAPVIRLWRQSRKSGVLPDETTLRAAQALTGYRKLKLDPKRRTVELQQGNMRLDVGGIAKGYAADQAIAALRKQGILRAMVAMSGDVAVSNAPPGRRGWRVGLDSFDERNRPVTRVLELVNRAVSTSGDKEQHVDIGGKRYSHIVDPVTGLGLTNPLTVSVVARWGIDADGFDTAMSVMGLERAKRFIEGKRKAAALMVVRSSPPRIVESSRFRKLKTKRSESSESPTAMVF